MVFSLDNIRRDFRRNRANEKDGDLNRDSVNTIDNQDVRVDGKDFHRIGNNDFRWGFRRRFRHEISIETNNYKAFIIIEYKRSKAELSRLIQSKNLRMQSVS